jgi:hypothetical protein
LCALVEHGWPHNTPAHTLPPRRCWCCPAGPGKAAGAAAATTAAGVRAATAAAAAAGGGAVVRAAAAAAAVLPQDVYSRRIRPGWRDVALEHSHQTQAEGGVPTTQSTSLAGRSEWAALSDWQQCQQADLGSGWGSAAVHPLSSPNPSLHCCPCAGRAALEAKAAVPGRAPHDRPAVALHNRHCWAVLRTRTGCGAAARQAGGMGQHSSCGRSCRRLPGRTR